jgi:hypothetical protein
MENIKFYTLPFEQFQNEAKLGHRQIFELKKGVINPYIKNTF